MAVAVVDHGRHERDGDDQPVGGLAIPQSIDEAGEGSISHELGHFLRCPLEP